WRKRHGGDKRKGDRHNKPRLVSCTRPFGFEGERKAAKRTQKDKLPDRANALKWQMPGSAAAEPPPPIYSCWEDYICRTTRTQRMQRCYAAAKKANRKRLLSDAPGHR